jgi:hypothetical protein
MLKMVNPMHGSILERGVKNYPSVQIFGTSRPFLIHRKV